MYRLKRRVGLGGIGPAASHGANPGAHRPSSRTRRAKFGAGTSPTSRRSSAGGFSGSTWSSTSGAAALSAGRSTPRKALSERRRSFSASHARLSAAPVRQRRRRTSMGHSIRPLVQRRASSWRDSVCHARSTPRRSGRRDSGAPLDRVRMSTAPPASALVRHDSELDARRTRRAQPGTDDRRPQCRILTNATTTLTLTAGLICNVCTRFVPVSRLTEAGVTQRQARPPGSSRIRTRARR
jgi:hypothetical protein